MLECWRGPTGTVILGDEMGLSKTWQTIVACLEDKETLPGKFDLVVTTKSCVQEWITEIRRHLIKVDFHPRETNHSFANMARLRGSLRAVKSECVSIPVRDFGISDQSCPAGNLRRTWDQHQRAVKAGRPKAVSDRSPSHYPEQSVRSD